MMIFYYFFLSIAITLPNTEILNEHEIQKNIIKYTQENITNTEKECIITQLKSALQSISETKNSKNKIQEYQNIINNFSSIIHQLHEEENNEYNLENNQKIKISNSNKLKLDLLKVNEELNNLNQKLQQEQDILRSINDSLLLLPQQHTQTKKKLNEINQKISNISITKITSHLQQAQFIALQTTKEAMQTKITELELAQLSANNRQELSRLRIELLKNKYNRLDNKLHEIHIQLHDTRKQETKQTIDEIENLVQKTEKTEIFPINIGQQFKINRHLSQSLKEQIEHIHLITLQQRQTDIYTLQARQALSKLLEQAQWINQSQALGETLRSQVSKLPKKNIYQLQQLDNEMNKLKNERLEYEEQINKLSLLSQNKKNNQTLSSHQIKILNVQIETQKKLLNSLLQNNDIQILELTKLKIAHEQLKDVMKNIEDTIHHYLFWTPDIHPINLSYLYKIYQDLHLLFKNSILTQLLSSIKISFINNKKSSIIFFMLLTLICCSYTTYHRKYYFFLTHSNKNFKNTNNFLITLQNILLSGILAAPIPTLLLIMGYNLSQTWEFPISSAIGDGLVFSSPILWLLITFSYFTLHDGLFRIHFNWHQNTDNKSTPHYSLFITTIILSITMMITCNNYNNKELYDSLGRLFFIILCICLTLLTYNLKQKYSPTYTHSHKYNPNKNIINKHLWNIMIFFPIICAITSCFGYLSTSQTLLMRLETSLIVGIISLIIYNTVINWINTQKHKILIRYNIINKKNKTYFKQNSKKKSLESLLKKPINTYNTTKNTSETKNNISILSNLDLNLITQESIKLIRSIMTFITSFIIFSLWSELYFIYEFLEKITISDIICTLPNTYNIQFITIKKLLITTLIFLIIKKIIKYLPSLLILTILQHLNFAPGTNYAIIILTKHILILLSIIIICSYLGIEWSKLQWLIAAVGVGLGFGLQEIFANFISGLIILFEQPIRIEDTITIGNLTGHVTQINTRATTITDWDHKEIIIPNKEFITKKFINWSLSDSTTRIVLKIPGPPNVCITKIIQILLDATKSCPLVLHTPQPEVYLINLEKGIPLFEIRIYTAYIKNRMLLKHQVHMLIIHFYKKNGLQLPFPHIQIN